MSSILINVILYNITKEVKENIKKLQIFQRKLEPMHLTECEFADEDGQKSEGVTTKFGNMEQSPTKEEPNDK